MSLFVSRVCLRLTACLQCDYCCAKNHACVYVQKKSKWKCDFCYDNRQGCYFNGFSLQGEVRGTRSSHPVKASSPLKSVKKRRKSSTFVVRVP